MSWYFSVWKVQPWIRRTVHAALVLYKLAWVLGMGEGGRKITVNHSTNEMNRLISHSAWWVRKMLKQGTVPLNLVTL